MQDPEPGDEYLCRSSLQGKCEDEAIKREMENVSVAFEILEDGKRPSAAHKKVPFHMIYDIKMDFTRKAMLVAEGCRTPNPVTSTYAGVVSR